MALDLTRPERPERTEPRRRYARSRPSTSLACPVCGAQDSQVLETRTPKGGPYVRRMRECGACAARYRTVETPAK